MRMEKRLEGLSSRRELHITDASLCGLPLRDADAQSVQAYYLSLLELGVSYVQIPMDALQILGTSVDPGRTVLSITSGCAEVPSGFAGYLSADSGVPGWWICECALGATPPEYADEIRWAANDALFFGDYADTFTQMAEARFAFCPHGAGELGTALAVEWLLAGGRQLTAGFMGTDGLAPLEEVLAALHVYGLLPELIRLDKLRSVSEAYQRLSGCNIPAHKAVVGSALFDVESGVHVDGLTKDRQCYEPFAPDSVGARRRIVIGKHSGKRALLLKLAELGLSGEYDLYHLLELVREESMRMGGGLDDRTFTALAKRSRGGDAA